jgi:hypothetical protein
MAAVNGMVHRSICKGIRMALQIHESRIPSTRGLIRVFNKNGKRFRLTDLKRWVRLNHDVFKAKKIDIALRREDLFLWDELYTHIQEQDLVVSLSVDCTDPPDSFFTVINPSSLLDIVLKPSKIPLETFDQWLDAASQHQIAIRVQWPMPLHHTVPPVPFSERLSEAGVRVVDFSAYDLLTPDLGVSTREEATELLESLPNWADVLEGAGIEVNFTGFPYCALPETVWNNIYSKSNCHLDHQHYIKASYELALDLNGRSPIIAGKLLQIYQAKYTFFDDPIDQRLLPWLLESPWLRARIVAWHKLTRHRRITRAVPTALPDTESSAEAFMSRKKSEWIHELGPECGGCRLRAICDHVPSEFTKALPGVEPKALSGDTVMDPHHFVRKQSKFYDEMDQERLNIPALTIELAAEAHDRIQNTSPSKQIDSFQYSIEGQWCHQLPGGLRWYGFTNSEKRSTALATLNPPFTLSYVVGGGIAEYAGFSLGETCRLLCPMEGYNHTLTLHVDERGRYVLLRDGTPVRPTEFEGHYPIPLRLGTHLEPRICFWNIDHSVVTQNVDIWTGDTNVEPPSHPVKFTFVTVCVRYARRLQMVLQSIAHQEGVPHVELEIIVAYVPGVDFTEDVLDTIESAYPEITLIRSAFSEENSRAKGLMINEAVDKAHGDWVVLLDADTVIHPGLLQQVLNQPEDSQFFIPDGRKLLNPKITSQMLLGELKPWEDWEGLLKTEGELRYREAEGVPIGFCQIVRRSCFETVRYFEADHFEGADWQFSVDMREHFGEETRLLGYPVLHLDHGGSKWYGTSRHY